MTIFGIYFHSSRIKKKKQKNSRNLKTTHETIKILGIMFNKDLKYTLTCILSTFTERWKTTSVNNHLERYHYVAK